MLLQNLNTFAAALDNLGRAPKSKILKENDESVLIPPVSGG
jgi:molybdopterin converting factor small subunit